MNNEYLERAKKVVPDAKTLILLASRRATELAYGMRPMVRCNHLDVALLEIAEGKLAANFDAKSDDFMQEIIAAREAAKRENGEIRMRHNHPANEE